MQKSVMFYELKANVQPMALLVDKSSSSNQDYLNKALYEVFKSNLDGVISVNTSPNLNTIIEIIDVDRNGAFGIIGKLDEISSKGILQGLRDANLESIEDSDELSKYYLEHFTYFYMNYNRMQIAVMYNSRAPKFKRNFKKFLEIAIERNINNLYLDNLYLAEVIDPEINLKIRKMNRLMEVNMISSHDPSVQPVIKGVSTDAFNISQSNTLNFKLHMNYEAIPIGNNMKKFLEDDLLISSNFEKLEIIGKDEDSKNIVVELVNKFLTKKVDIQIDQKYLTSKTDLNPIKDKLKNSF